MFSWLRCARKQKPKKITRIGPRECWISIPTIKVGLRFTEHKSPEPVVQGETNETYLRTNINGEHAEAGTLFLDETTDLTQDGNLIIYGHKMNDGTMFGTLDKFEDEEFFDNNGTVCWESEKGKEYYQIFALLVLPGYSTAPDFIDLQAWNNVLDEEQTADMLNTIADRASIFRGESFNLEKDKYIFLVTCDYSINNGRLVLVGRRLSKKSETEKNTEESTDSSEEAVLEEENSAIQLSPGV